MALIVSAILFVIFAANVVIGASGSPPFLSDIWQMLTLFAASAAFVVAVLRREARAEEKQKNTD
jgi:membrane protein implicated in regulation of membrane protease activity